MVRVKSPDVKTSFKISIKSVFQQKCITLREYTYSYKELNKKRKFKIR